MPALLTTMLSPPRPSAVGDQFVGRVALADVAGDRDGLGAGGGDLVEHVGGVERGGDVVDDDGGAGAGQADGLGAAQPRGRTGHHRDRPDRSVAFVLLVNL